MTDLIQALKTPVAEPGTGQVVTGRRRLARRWPRQGHGRRPLRRRICRADQLYGVVVSGTIAKGRILDIDIEEAMLRVAWSR
jgi:xanthine dehydrogenase YagR molybdenum-binding subunit